MIGQIPKFPANVFRERMEFCPKGPFGEDPRYGIASAQSQ